MDTVKDHMAKSEKDFQRLIKDESDLLDVMETQVASLTKARNDAEKNLLEMFNLEVYTATPKQVEIVEKKLSDELKGKVRNVFRVINRNTQKRFDEYLHAHGKPRVRQFWHGSKNENWWNILCQGLFLHPDAPITGKMFGEGLYFAPSATKSWGYTSGKGSFWAHGKSNTAFMALCATAYGHPQEVDTYSGYSSYNAAKFE